MARRSDVGPEMTRNLLLDAAERLFARDGVAKTSLADIAAAAGFTRGALYWHFSGKGELLDALFARFEISLEDLAREVDRQEQPLQALRDYWLGVMVYLQRSERAQRILEIRVRKCEYIDEFKETEARVARWIGNALALTQSAFADAGARGQLVPNVDPAHAAASLIGLLTGFGYLSASVGDALALDGTAALAQFFDLVSAQPLANTADDIRDHVAA